MNRRIARKASNRQLPPANDAVDDDDVDDDDVDDDDVDDDVDNDDVDDDVDNDDDMPESITCSSYSPSNRQLPPMTTPTMTSMTYHPLLVHLLLIVCPILRRVLFQLLPNRFRLHL
jgi:hypothetical protein